MKRRPTFWNGVLVAAILALATSILVTGLAPVIGLVPAIKLTTTLLGLAYLLYLVKVTRVKTGRVLTLSAWVMLATACWWLNVPLSFFLLVHIGAIWLFRVLMVCSGMIPALADAALTILAVLTFSWAFQRTGSILMATWCFFLVQAFWVQLPRSFRIQREHDEPASSNRQFDLARRRADAALHQLFTQKS